ncbi:UDP-N-acetylmuramate--L-alanine ligase [bacterium]|nr:UDP-N-acetylmuramate--L-alanine ligase [bacterium]
MFKKVERIHFIGIGGAGMSGMAEVLFNLGYKVTGSDITENQVTKRLKNLGIKVYLGHRGSQVGPCHVVVTSSAIPPNNPEVKAAIATKIPVIPRAVMLAELMRMKEGIAIAGTHGKTTTTAMVARVLAKGGLDPTFVIGGILKRTRSSANLGKGDFLVAEADESDGSFLHLSPAIAVVTSIDKDHLDYYGSLKRLKETFLEFVNKVPFYGLAILCSDDPNIRDLLPRLEKRYLTYGLKGPAEIVTRGIKRTKKGLVEFSVIYYGKNLGRITLGLPGIHNVSNSLAAIGVGLELGIDFINIRKALKNLKGVERRLEIKGKKESILVIDDYAHHPTEVRAALATIKGRYPKKRLVGIFQHHRYTRTRDLLKEFATCFKGLDILILTRIYPAGEKPIPGVKTKSLLPLMAKRKKPEVRYIASLNKIVEHLLKILEPNDLILTLGAGDVYWVGEELLRKLG